MRPALLGDIVHKLPMDGAGAVPEVPITGIACEPDEIRPGDLYVALARRTPGSIAAAVNRGAVAVWFLFVVGLFVIRVLRPLTFPLLSRLDLNLRWGFSGRAWFLGISGRA